MYNWPRVMAPLSSFEAAVSSNPGGHILQSYSKSVSLSIVSGSLHPSGIDRVVATTRLKDIWGEAGEGKEREYDRDYDVIGLSWPQEEAESTGPSALLTRIPLARHVALRLRRQKRPRCRGCCRTSTPGRDSTAKRFAPDCAMQYSSHRATVNEPLSVGAGPRHDRAAHLREGLY
ncbi:hypothetical protein CTA1_2069 [Colletotrichum tanaceti]|uniref:Uncharacterized protein n=1 Tax=Colletotrichum tanaceti TaxID=1306861 RepID=A0A4U6X908_9PEZI|nr:hypothetical protein CTA1_2069 [Colletotrichum tanaceti]